MIAKKKHWFWSKPRLFDPVVELLFITNFFLRHQLFFSTPIFFFDTNIIFSTPTFFSDTNFFSRYQLFFQIPAYFSDIRRGQFDKCFTGPKDPKIWKTQIKIKQNSGLRFLFSLFGDYFWILKNFRNLWLNSTKVDKFMDFS